MYKIYFVDMGKATGYREIGRRPVVCIGSYNDKVKVLKLTTRLKDNKYHIRMNPYMVRGFCDCGDLYLVDKKWLQSFKRECTISEQKAITAAYSYLKNKGKVRIYENKEDIK